jgi:AcrR family transcriptional regulator
MSRNIHPEETIAHILEVSTTLFINKGYDKTTIQDIISALRMSKGAIYHHFRSKEEILQAVINQRSMYAKQLMLTLVHQTKANTAKEKITKILKATLTDKTNHAIDPILVSQTKNPQFVLAGLQSTVWDDAPILAKLFEEGNNDGSLSCKSPTLCAEVFILLINIWINPALFARNKEETTIRLYYVQELLLSMGADIITSTLIEQILESYQEMNIFSHDI